VLLDSLDSRSRIAHDVHVWHRAAYRGHPDASGSTYDEAHRHGCPASAAVQQPGDYDARVLTLDACGYVEDPAKGTLSFVLETSETCYAATEQGAHPWGCKHLPLATSADVGMRFEGTAVRRRQGDRLCLVASYVTVLTSDRQLVLCRRSSAVRSGPGVVSASAGGVCEPGDGRRGDRDSLGWPDPILSARRELQEEIGLDVPRSSIRPAALFLANSTNPHRHGEGQLVATVLSIARVTESYDELTASVWTRSDLATGRYEVDDLLGLPLSGTADDLMTAVEPLLEDLDQHGALSIVYVAAAVWGRDEARRSYERMIDQAGRNPVSARAYVDPSVLSVPTTA
jgi:8-oxo-dGTP pyrophosphatase MutT (NUDIX family)